MSVPIEASADMRARVFEFEREQAKKTQVQLRVETYFAPGIYARELHIPAGTEITGRVHRFENFNILSQGEMIVTTDIGVEHVRAPYSCVSRAGTKRAARTLTDCIWTTILGTNETDPEIIQKLFTTNDEQEFLAGAGILNIKEN